MDGVVILIGLSGGSWTQRVLPPVEADEQTPHAHRQRKSAAHGNQQHVDHHPVAQTWPQEDQGAVVEQLRPVGDGLEVHPAHHREARLPAVEPDERKVATHHWQSTVSSQLSDINQKECTETLSCTT